MTHDVVDRGRRRFLTTTTAVVGGVGVAVAAVPFVKSWLPSARARSAAAPIIADIGKIEAGQMVKYEWRGLPVFVVNRTPAQLATLDEIEKQLRDPNSEILDQQPPYANNQHRSIKREWLVLVGICTHLGCVPDYFGELQAQPFDPNWHGGFFCPCHKSRYDLAGRVYEGVPAPVNLQVPSHHYIDETHIEIGVDPKEAA